MLTYIRFYFTFIFFQFGTKNICRVGLVNTFPHVLLHKKNIKNFFNKKKQTKKHLPEKMCSRTHKEKVLKWYKVLTKNINNKDLTPKAKKIIFKNAQVLVFKLWWLKQKFKKRNKNQDNIYSSRLQEALDLWKLTLNLLLYCQNCQTKKATRICNECNFFITCSSPQCILVDNSIHSCEKLRMVKRKLINIYKYINHVGKNCF